MTDQDKQGPAGFAEGTDAATLLRDAATLQVKLVIDGLRDAVLIPLSLMAALLSLVLPGPDRGRLFYEVVRMGRRSERWINLFAAADRICPVEDEAGIDAGLDDYLAQVERRLASEFQGREAEGSAGRSVSALLDRIRAARGSFRKRDTEKE